MVTAYETTVTVKITYVYTDTSFRPMTKPVEYYGGSMLGRTGCVVTGIRWWGGLHSTSWTKTYRIRGFTCLATLFYGLSLTQRPVSHLRSSMCIVSLRGR